MKPKLSGSPLSSPSLRQTPERFERILGMSLQNFDQLVVRVGEQRLASLLAARICWEEECVKRLHESTSHDLAEHVCITLLYQRQYMMQEVLGAIFCIHQGSVSTIIKRIEPFLLQALPTPEALSNRIADQMEAMPAETLANFSVVVIGDGAEQPCQRPSDADEQTARYSGKKKLHTFKTQVLGTPIGLILDLSASRSGSMHDFRQWKSFRFNSGMKRILGLMGNRVIAYFDSAYQGIAERCSRWTVRLQQKAFRNKPLTLAQKTTNCVRSKIRIAIEHGIRRIKICRSCADRLRKTKEQRHQRRWQIAEGIANLRLISSNDDLVGLWT